MSNNILQSLLIFVISVSISPSLIYFINETSIIAVVKQKQSTEKETYLNPTEIVKLYYELALKGEFEKANKLITNTNGVVSSPQAYHTDDSKIIYEGKIEIRKVLCENIKGKNAIVITQVTDNGGHIYRLEHNLYQDKGEWKIWGIMVPGKSPCE